MNQSNAAEFTAFAGERRLISGSLADVALAVKQSSSDSPSPILIVDDSTGRTIDLDLRGTDSEILRRLPPASARLATAPTSPARSAIPPTPAASTVCA